MANQAKKSKDNKNLIIGICAAAAVVVVIILAVVLVNRNPALSDAYFVSDGTKYVLTIESDTEELENDEYTPLKTHLVYTYSGDTVTGMKTYYEYGDASSAKKAFDALKEELGDEATAMEINGKYIIITADEESYKDTTASDVKKQIDLMESLKNMNLNDTEDEEVVDVDTEIEE